MLPYPPPRGHARPGRLRFGGRTDLRPLVDLTIDEQEEVLQRGAGFGG
jgi:hypothetical protein